MGWCKDTQAGHTTTQALQSCREAAKSVIVYHAQFIAVRGICGQSTDAMNAEELDDLVGDVPFKGLN